MTKIVVINGEDSIKVGCIDPLASNYDPTANQACDNCCTYGSTIIGCRDPLALNYNSSADQDCDGCCKYTEDTTSETFEFTGFIEYKNQSGTIPAMVDYSSCPTDISCVDCKFFDWWNDTYILNHGGQSLQVSNTILWQRLVDVVTNSGSTFYVDNITGDLLDENCCRYAGGVFRDGICFCETPENEELVPTCVATLPDFLTLISTSEGEIFFNDNFFNIGSALGLTNTQINFVKSNLFNINDDNANGTPDQNEARLILSNALNVTGGFYVNLGYYTNKPYVVNKGTCDSIKGYWDTSSNQCMCNPIVDQCEIDITQVETTTTEDFFNNSIKIVTKDGKPITEACCNRLIKDYNLPWTWQSPYCYAEPYEDCLPVTFTLNDSKTKVPACETDLEISMWVYIGKPLNPCQPIPDPPDDDIIFIDGAVCDITLSPNTKSIESTTTNKDVINAALDTGGIGNSDITTDGTTPTDTSSVCCYNTNNPILARISLTNPLINPYLVQVKEYNSSSDYFDKWVEIKATLATSGLTLDFGVNLEIYQGLNCCCSYDIFVDDIRINCAEQESVLVVNDIKCPGFNLTKTIDNKKSWTYNPGTPEIGISDYDIIEREDGSFGMLNGEGTINRTFAPSLDADIPWRYTDYWQQSSVYERHSNLVLNSKELWLTFDMCADCIVSSALTITNTEVTGYHTYTDVDISDPLTDGNVGTYISLALGINRIMDDNPKYLITKGTDIPLTGLTYSDFINYFISSINDNPTNDQLGGGPYSAYTYSVVGPVTTIRVLSLECLTTNTNRLKVQYYYSGSTSDIAVSDPYTFVNGDSCQISSETTTGTTYTYLSLLELEQYKKTFQSFWIPFMEQFIPATTIWVAGERWCNEPCVEIAACDYDYELVSSSVDVQPIPEGIFPPNNTSNTKNSTTVPTTTTSKVDTTNTTSSGSINPNPENILLITDYGLTTSTPLIITEDEYNIDIDSYRDKFSESTTIVE